MKQKYVNWLKEKGFEEDKGILFKTPLYWKELKHLTATISEHSMQMVVEIVPAILVERKDINEIVAEWEELMKISTEWKKMTKNS